MGAKTSMLVYSLANASDALRNGPLLDRETSTKLASQLFPNEKLIELEDSHLAWTCPPDDEIRIGCFSGVSIVAAKEFRIGCPSQIIPRFLRSDRGANVTLHAMHSVVDWFAFAHWKDERLVRSLSLSPDSGLLEDTGERLAFEIPYWLGQHPAIDEDDGESQYPFPFHPLELGEAALKEFFGYQLEGMIDDSLIDPENIPLMSFRRKKSIWKFWR